MLEAAAEVLVGPARCLHYSIKCHAVVYNDFAHLKFLPDVEQSNVASKSARGTLCSHGKDAGEFMLGSGKQWDGIPEHRRRTDELVLAMNGR